MQKANIDLSRDIIYSNSVIDIYGLKHEKREVPIIEVIYE